MLPIAGQLPTNRARHEQYKNHRRSYPKRSIKIRVAFQHVEKVCARIQRCPASLYDFVCIDVEELRIELYGPEKLFGGAARA